MDIAHRSYCSRSHHMCVLFSHSHWWISRTPSFLLFIYVSVSISGLNKLIFKTFSVETIIIIKAWSFKLCKMINIFWISYFHTGFGDFSRISRSLQHLKMQNVFDRTEDWTRTLIYSWSNVAVKRVNVVGVGLSLQTIFCTVSRPGTSCHFYLETWTEALRIGLRVTRISQCRSQPVLIIIVLMEIISFYIVFFFFLLFFFFFFFF